MAEELTLILATSFSTPDNWSLLRGLILLPTDATFITLLEVGLSCWS